MSPFSQQTERVMRYEKESTHLCGVSLEPVNIECELHMNGAVCVTVCA